jgi:8-oxo-dGTP diphosphatase
MTLYLVRHASAGVRDDRDPADQDRPLDQTGQLQAEKLADWLRHEPITRIVSSPFERCRETVERLAKHLDLEVVVDERLAEGTEVEDSWELLSSLAGRTVVLCSHGDVIPDTIEALVRRGMQLRSAPDWRKATVWVLKRDRDGVFTTATVWAPPPL